MDHSSHNKLISFIWSIADDCLRDVYVRGKYRDVILPMVVLRRLDALLEPTKEAVLAEVKYQKEEMESTELDEAPLSAESGYVFYNTSKWTLQKLKDTATNNQQILQSNFEEYLNGFSENVKEIVKCFDLKNQVIKMANNDVLLDVLEKFVSPKVNLTPIDMEDPDGNKLQGLSNLGMGYVYEELIRKFNEDNNEEAGEHYTPREIIELMTHLVFDPVKDKLPLTITIYDPACGSGGMLTESQDFIQQKYPSIANDRDIYLYGKESVDETYAICKSDMMIKDNDPSNIRFGSTLATDEFAVNRFDFMLSNPPYGKSWSKDLKYIKDGKKVIDSRFLVELKDYWGNTLTEDATPRSSDGQLLFLMEMITKMKPMENSPFGSRIASVHNGSSLFTGDAGSGESNVRRYIIENDMLEAIIQLPNNIFYNTGITTYIWLLNNNKPSERQGKVQLIDASLLSQKLIKNLGDKNCEFSPQHIIDITNVYLDSAVIKRQLDKNKDPVGIASQVFDNKDFGYYKVIIERPDRRKAQFRDELIAPLRFDKALREPMEYLYLEHGEKVYQEGFLKTQEKNILAWCEENEFSLNTKNKTKLLNTKNWNKLLNNHTVANELKSVIGATEFGDFNLFKKTVESTAKCLSKTSDIKIDSSGKNAILNANSWYDENAPKVIKNTTKFKQEKLDTLLNHLNCRESDLADYGYYSTENKNEYITYETCTELKDAELIPVKDDIYHYFLKEVKPHVGESWINLDSTKIGYEINFNNYFYKQKSLRDMKLIAMEIIDLEQGAEGLIAGVLGIDVADIHGEP